MTALDPVQEEILTRSCRLTVIGITGTKGKTTTTALIGHLLNHAGVTAACATTVETIIPGEQPWPPCKTQRILRDLLALLEERAIRHLVVETTSYSLGYGLADAVAFSGAVFTNLGSDHLNYHGTVETYFLAKQKLFASLGRHPLPERPWYVVNGDDPAGRRLVEEMPEVAHGLVYGLARGRTASRRLDFTARRPRYSPRGAKFRLHAPDLDLEMPVQTRLVGEFNVYNTLAAVCVAYIAGLEPELVCQGLASFFPPPGRFEVAGGRDGRPVVVVDYAHTPESLAQVLREARRLAGKGRVWTVFGCGGETDPGKRPLMGRAAAAASDHVVLTNDNPRREDPLAIIAQIEAGCAGGRALVETLPDRRGAIAAAVSRAGPRDVVLVAGRGHETEQIFATGRVPFSDREFVYELLGRSPGDPAYLPPRVPPPE